MPLPLKGSLGSNLEIDCTVDDKPFPYIVGISYTHIVNGGRKVALDLAGYHAIESTPLGSKITVKIGKGDTIHNLDFEGFIYEITPRVSGGSIIAMDYIAQLAQSTAVEYKTKDIIGKDLYYLAASAANYKGVDVSDLTEGSGIMATEDMDLQGLQTRREFIDKCFKFMTEIIVDNFHDEPSVVNWRYAIRRNNKLDFYKEDNKNTSMGFKIKVSEEDNNLLGKGIMASISTSQLVNSATYQSSLNSELHATVTDEQSVEQYGIAAKIYQFKTLEYDRLEELAYKTILINKEPTVIYRLQLSNAEHLTLGDYVKVSAPPLKDIILPVVEVRHIIRESIESIITLGSPEASLSELIKAIR